MNARFHRALLYWVLLLVPTLAAGVGGLWLVAREQNRLQERARAAAESRREAIEARTRLIAENVELLVGDVEAGLMTTLREVPREGAEVERFLDDWERTNPLVKSTFRLSRQRTLERPPSSALAPNGDRRWLNSMLASRPPWAPERAQAPALKEERAEWELRRDTQSNVGSVQSARSAIKDVALLKGQPAAAQFESKVTESENSGWLPFAHDDGMHLFGWRLLADGAVVGVEINLAEVVKRFAELLPKDANLADAFVLRERGGLVIQSKTYESESSLRSRVRETPMSIVPISATVLPGWEVAGFASDLAAASVAGRDFFLVGSVVIAVFVAAVVAGSTLLVGQARRSEAEAAQKTSFVANVSHEFKTPLTTIRLYAELLAQGRVRDAAQRDDYLSTIGKETERLARLVNNALDFSRLEQGRKKYAIERLDLSADLARLLEMHAPRLSEAGMTLHATFPAEPCWVEGDRDAIGQIVLNLIDNACKYAAAGREIRVTIRPEASEVHVRVSDRGPGVPADHREKIFEKFHRVDDALTSEQAGAGLGLSIARQLARGMGGELRYEDRSGGGAEFVLTLPGSGRPLESRV